MALVYLLPTSFYPQKQNCQVASYFMIRSFEVKKKKKKKSKLGIIFYDKIFWSEKEKEKEIQISFNVWHCSSFCGCDLKKKSNFIKITFSWSFFIYKLKCLVKTMIEIDVEK